MPKNLEIIFYIQMAVPQSSYVSYIKLRYTLKTKSGDIQRNNDYIPENFETHLIILLRQVLRQAGLHNTV